jgi:chorismate synthase
MSGSSFGRVFRITTWGESHGRSIGVVVEGCPPGMELSEQDIQAELDRRRPGQSRLTSQRREEDRVQILSGLFEGRTLGTPIAMMVENRDARPQDYEEMKEIYRPSHADMTYDLKYGLRNWMGGGRASARETIGRVAAGAIARKWLSREYGIDIVAWVGQVRELQMPEVDIDRLSREDVDRHPVRCPHPETAEKMAELIDQTRKDRDSLGGVVEVVARGCPAGWGEPVFEKLDAMLAFQYMSLPAAKGVEIGSGFRGIALTGSTHNDEFFMEEGQIRTRTNRSGGIQGGISNGMPIVARIAFKPTSTIPREQCTVNARGEEVSLVAKGRHDPCVLPRAVPIVEAATAIVLMDLALRDRGQMGPRDPGAFPIKNRR